MMPAPTTLRTLAVLVFSLILPLPGHAADPGYSIDPEPAWVEHQAVPATPAGAATGAVDLLLLDMQHNLSGGQQVYNHRAYRPRTPGGVGDASEIRIQFNPEYQKLRLHSIRLLRGSESREVVQQARVRLLQREESLDQGIQDGVMTADIIVDDVRVGDVLDYSYTIEGSNPVFGQRLFGYLPLNHTVPIERVHARVLARDNQPVYFNQIGGNLPLTKKRSGGLTSYALTRERVPAVQADEGAPSWYATHSWLEYSEYANWAEVEAWALKLYQQAAGDSSAVKAEAVRLRKESRDDADFIARSLFFVQNEIRYLGLELGTNSHLPHSPAEVLQKRYGDCKDKSLLLSEILRQGGIKAWPALVSTQFNRGIRTQAPSPGVFDHVIARVDYNGQAYWLDGTRLYQAGSLPQIAPNDLGYALVIGKGSRDLDKMYATPPEEQATDVVQHYYASDFKGPVRLQVLNRFTGQAADFQRYVHKNVPPADIEKHLLNFYGYYYPSVRMAKPPVMSDDTANNEVTITEEYEIPDYWENGKEGYSGRIMLSGILDALDYPKHVTRSTPFALPSRRTISSTTYFHYPLDVHILVSKEPRDLHELGVSYYGEDRYQNNVYIQRAKLQIAADQVEAKDMPGYAKLVKSILGESNFSMNIPAPAAAALAPIETLKSRLENLARKTP